MRRGIASLSGLLFSARWSGRHWPGTPTFNNRQLVDGGPQVSLWQFVTSSDFAVDVAENWQAEYLQFFLYIFATVWLVQRGSPESKPVGAAHAVTEESG